MSKPGERLFGEDLAPVFELTIVEQRQAWTVKTDITQYIKSVQFESALDIADMLTIEVNNPGFLGINPDYPDFTAHRVFQPGNEIELRAGYGSADKFIGRAILTKHLPEFPEDSEPTLTIKGYDKSFLMMDTTGPIKAAKENRTVPVHTRPVGKYDDIGTPFIDMKASDVVQRVAEKYGMWQNIDETERLLRGATGDGIVQKKGMKDYELVRILANLNNREFFVDFQPGTGWTLNWVKPAEKDDPELIFRYGDGDSSTLLSFSCEYGLRETVNEIVVMIRDTVKDEWVSAVIVEDAEGIDPRWRVGGGRMTRSQPVSTEKLTTKDPGALAKKPAKTNTKAKKQKANEAVLNESHIKHALKSATEFRIAAAGHAIDVKSDRPFESLQDAADFAARWFKERKDHFLVGKGKLIGVETLRARQVHRLEGIGPRLSGDWYFISVNHNWDADSGYSCEFTARKVMS